jgi:carbonic anhydrase
MDDLIDGVGRFRHAVFPAHRRLFEALAHGQSPGVLFIACADSRVDPSLITQSPPGRLFVLRNAGNLVPDADTPPGGEAATLHYAVEELAVSHIVVCGHSGCGAMQALMGGGRLPPILQSWLRHAEPVRRRVASGDVAAAVDANVLLQLENLRTHRVVARAERAGQLQLHGWVYDIPSGAIRAWDASARAFRPLDEAQTEAALVHDLEAAGEPVEEGWVDHGPYTVTLVDAGPDRQAILQAVAQVTGEDLQAAAARVDAIPNVLLHGLTATEAEVVVAWIADSDGHAEAARSSS